MHSKSRPTRFRQPKHMRHSEEGFWQSRRSDSSTVQIIDPPIRNVQEGDNEVPIAAIVDLSQGAEAEVAMIRFVATNRWSLDQCSPLRSWGFTSPKTQKKWRDQWKRHRRQDPPPIRPHISRNQRRGSEHQLSQRKQRRELLTGGAIGQPQRDQLQQPPKYLSPPWRRTW